MFPQSFTCSVVLWYNTRFFCISPTGLLPSLVDLSRSLMLYSRNFHVLTEPHKTKFYGLGSSPFARRYLGNRVFFLFLGVLRWFSSPGIPPITYVFSYGYLSISPSGFPHSEIYGSTLICSSP
jgi:hypothetical protein